ncbi:hypothetical protein Y032_0207g2016 [Ancylostoma ceylanicum]|uniref:Golgin subfamily A member 7/ERF4 domain-containing protein n=1 Tax=Ancylostoma ceylanicum TaxID=53326 RepID=A0A016SKS0_9BILA|nr:hypothetical protein Y032_0207g2016 [Ancylostoma ceylanicum]
MKTDSKPASRAALDSIHPAAKGHTDLISLSCQSAKKGFLKFGLNSRFDTDFPSELIGRVAPEELSDTLGRINNVLKRHVQMSSRWLLCGLLFCCCSFGCSLFPVVCLNRRTVTAVEKTLDHENICLYHKLGLHWRLVKRPVDGSRLTEYVLELQTLPKVQLMLPD